MNQLSPFRVLKPSPSAGQLPVLAVQALLPKPPLSLGPCGAVAATPPSKIFISNIVAILYSLADLNSITEQL